MPQMPEAMHPYESLSLGTVGLISGIGLILLHLWMLLKPEESQKTLQKLPRNYNAGVATMSLGMLWFWLLIAPELRGSLSMIGGLSMDLGEFNFLKPVLQLAVPITAFLLITQVKEFLFVRGLGLLALMAAAPMLESAFLKEPSSRVALSFYAYVLLTLGLFWIGMPYIFRDTITWATKTAGRYKSLTFAGLGYGLLITLLSFTQWRGH